MTAIEHLRRLVAKNPMSDECPYCNIYVGSEVDHAPDCPWLAAKMWVEDLDRHGVCEHGIRRGELCVACAQDAGHWFLTPHAIIPGQDAR